MTVRRDAPSQGSLHMEMPAPRERLADMRLDHRAAAQQPPAAPAAEEAEPAPKSGLFSRWTSPRPAAAPVAPQQRMEPKAPSVASAPAARPAAPAARPAADMSATRVSASDRLTTSKAEEDMLDIPAFLRRQAN